MIFFFSVTLCPASFQLIYSYSSAFHDFSWPGSVAVGDINNDGDLDMIIAKSKTGHIEILIGNGIDSFTLQTTLFTGEESIPQLIVMNDFNNDSQLDLAVVKGGSKNIGIFLGNGDATFRAEVTFLNTVDNDDPTAIAIGDFNEDRYLDLVVANGYAHNIRMLLGNNDGNFRDHLSFYTGDFSSPGAVAVGDFNKDGHLDIVVTCFGNNYIYKLFGSGNGSFTEPIPILIQQYSMPTAVVVADFNRDNRLDIAVVNSNLYDTDIMLGEANGTFAEPITYSTAASRSVNSIVAGDFNNDNKLDLVIANYYTRSLGILLGIGNGSFLEQTTILPEKLKNRPWAVAVSDFNRDNKLDLVITDGINSTVIVLLNTCTC